MAFGILDDYKLDSVPGTGLLSAKVNQVTTDGAGDLKRGTGKHSHIVLIPQPSDDPRDPLNWPRWKKETCFWMLVFASTLEGALYPLASAGYGLLAKEFEVSVDEITSSFSACFLGLGMSALVQNALAFKYGRRPAFLLSSFVMFVSCAWTALSRDLASIRASCTFLGLGMVAPEVLVPTTIEHMFLGPFIYGYVIQNLSWQLGFWLAGLACGVCFVGVFFFVPETTYHRQGSDEDSASQDRHISDMDSVRKTAPTPETPGQNIEVQDVGRNASLPKPPSFLSHLKIYNGTFSDESLWKIFVRPFPFLLSPVTWFMFLSYSLPTVWFAVTNLCSSTIFTITNHFNPAQIGLTHLSGLVGTIIGALVAGPFNDWTIVRISQRNRGIYEPEFRLIFMLAMLFGVFGYAGWAIGVDHHMPWIGSVAYIATLNVGLAVSGGAAMAYLLDTHGANAVHVVSLVNSGRDLVLYGATFFANGFIASRGVKTSLVVLAVCQSVSALAAVAMYVCGKRVRSFVARHPRFFHGNLVASGYPQSATATAETDSAEH
ncbi:MFS general substrate transporter [Ganoderma sinense ZZ0214-1]|uniref:MFS general substrate transporter n=1 Tax=Ganoderma sinense ZZ0214-1 TaxID=1077348 RepID=A0A2G8S0G9_9APHY|nr:MFS general substrate transporter [Ganoderma sinense ZZ0214-1]